MSIEKDRKSKEQLRPHQHMSIPAFLDKTYKILEVPFRLFRIKISLKLSVGMKRETPLLSGISMIFKLRFCPNISSTATWLRSSDR